MESKGKVWTQLSVFMRVVIRRDNRREIVYITLKFYHEFCYDWYQWSRRDPLTKFRRVSIYRENKSFYETTTRNWLNKYLFTLLGTSLKFTYSRFNVVLCLILSDSTGLPSGRSSLLPYFRPLSFSFSVSIFVIPPDSSLRDTSPYRFLDSCTTVL